MRKRTIKGVEGEKRSSKGDPRNNIYIYNNISIGWKNSGEEGINLESCIHPFTPPLRFRPVAILRHPLYSLSPRVLNSPLSLSRCNPLSIVVIIVIIPAKRRPVVERSFPPLDSRESGRNLSRARIPNGRGREEKKEKYEITVRDLISSRYLHGSARYFRPVGGWNAWPCWRGGVEGKGGGKDCVPGTYPILLFSVTYRDALGLHYTRNYLSMCSVAFFFFSFRSRRF